ncbi:hypothetical protein [Gandjariella thermophila]|uniref:Uncharacterized protein n=1 Tax=Gandjariella thermophila TaxID=1931992 RepID=A0A4D4J2V1_9PSEU|nr:hypothetical protein [Gandjariella thermophila]GDY29480.1 hypothetical protein GTS_11130 [Gandjariella thermophila]
MSGESGSERTQRTVAELLAQYGGKPSAGGQRRRRRRAEGDNPDTAPQTIINRVLSDSGRLLPVNEEEHRRGAHSPHRRRSEQPRPPARYQDPPSGYTEPGTGYHRPAAPPDEADPAAETRYLPPTPARGERGTGSLAGPTREPVTEQIPRVAAPPGLERTQSIPPAGALDHTQAIPPAGSMDHTQAIPPATGALEETQAHPVLEDTQGHPGPYLDDDYDRYDEPRYPGGPPSGEIDRFADEEPIAAAEDSADAETGAEPEAERSPGKEWLVMVGQLAAGVVGGAVLWLVFEWLWRTLPAAALGVAVAVTVGLVLIVRRIRRADDLQTTVLAVLVGLVVTVSPAALLLVGQ